MMDAGEIKQAIANLEEQLASLRASLTDESVTEKVRQLADWRHQVRSHPWVWCGAAAALGAVLAPRVQKAADANQPAAEAGSAGARPRSRLAKTVGELTGEALVGESVVYLIDQARAMLAGGALMDQPKPAQDQGPTPNEGANGVAEGALASGPESAPNAVPASQPACHLALQFQRQFVDNPGRLLLAALSAGVLIGWVAKRR